MNDGCDDAIIMDTTMTADSGFDCEEGEEAKEERPTMKSARLPSSPQSSPLPSPSSPQAIFRAPNKFIALIVFSRNNLESLPPELFQLEHLEYLDVSRNRLTSLSETFKSVRSVWYLDASHNRLSTLPPWFGGLRRARNIDFSHNPLGSSGGLTGVDKDFGKKARHLRTLNLSHCGLDKLPNMLLAARDMTTLILGEATGEPDDGAPNFLREISPPLNHAVGLVFLVASNIGLTELPDDINLLKNLRHLDVHANELYYLPQTLPQLQHLEFLNASSNNLEDLPVSIDRMPRLREVLLASNRLTWVTEDIGNACNNIKFLDLYGNKLDLEGAKSVAKLSLLEGLDLGSNYLSMQEIIGEMALVDYNKMQTCMRLRLRVEGTRSDPVEASDATWRREERGHHLMIYEERNDEEEEVEDDRSNQEQEEKWDEQSSTVPDNVSAEEWCWNGESEMSRYSLCAPMLGPRATYQATSVLGQFDDAE